MTASTAGLLGFAVIALFLVLSPGVNTMLIIQNASTFGPRIATFSIAGLCSATFFHGALSIFGISVLVLSSPTLYFVVKAIGAAYLAWLGAKMLWAAYRLLRLRPLEGQRAERPALSTKTPVQGFKEGFVTQLFNPKVSMFYLAAFPQFIQGARTVSEGFVLVLIHASLIASWFLVLSFSIGRMKRWIEQRTVQAAINGITGAVLLGFAVVALFH